MLNHHPCTPQYPVLALESWSPLGALEALPLGSPSPHGLRGPSWGITIVFAPPPPQYNCEALYLIFKRK